MFMSDVYICKTCWRCFNSNLEFALGKFVTQTEISVWVWGKKIVHSRVGVQNSFISDRSGSAPVTVEIARVKISRNNLKNSKIIKNIWQQIWIWWLMILNYIVNFWCISQLSHVQNYFHIISQPLVNMYIIRNDMKCMIFFFGHIFVCATDFLPFCWKPHCGWLHRNVW